jgi:mRNA interferase MazF
MQEVYRFEVYLVNLEPARGREMNKTRPCVVVSPDEINLLSTVIVAPLTSKGFELPTRVPCDFAGKPGLILLDHLRAVDKVRLLERLGVIDLESQQAICDTLQEMFAY